MTSPESNPQRRAHHEWSFTNGKPLLSDVFDGQSRPFNRNSVREHKAIISSLTAPHQVDAVGHRKRRFRSTRSHRQRFVDGRQEIKSQTARPLSRCADYESTNLQCPVILDGALSVKFSHCTATSNVPAGLCEVKRRSKPPQTVATLAGRSASGSSQLYLIKNFDLEPSPRH